MGQVLAIASQKGGVGKTTTAVNLSAAFARLGRKTLLVDVDPQGAVRYGAGLRPGHATVGFADYLSGARTLHDVILPTALPWMRVLLAGSVSEEAEHTAYQDRIVETSTLRDLLEMARSRSDIVVVDTPPGLGPIARRVLEGSQQVLVPLQCEPLALQTTPQMLRGIQSLIAANESLTLAGLLLTMYDESNPISRRVADHVRGNLPKGMVFDAVIPRTPGAVEAFAAGQPVVLRDPADPAAQAYTTLARELAEILK